MWWRIVLLVLAYLVLGAHFLRLGSVVWAILITVAPLILFYRKHIVVTLLQGGLIAGTLFVWVPTTYNLISMRILFEQPWLRMAVILGTVIVCNLQIVFLANRLKSENR
ncbi:hypothetical protein M3P05_18000 [Sansalvadorimonas sp. 2012CJ34-2]|uniref:Uncharacterized protein n=1 Tax=Parendozoicomonas callyspongiae TaxID=2942213 RepID=A0ABT0PKP1_9GAMM|nr:hypothetical protein [Sansalvadorimonas sp. 2012CJ34-2]MCL6271816.1 hypothetical protein [Sansalvadorimonas sp. 2012CJ34-2]